jgi:diaminopimelate epimerase
MLVHFYKYQGAGNDFVILDNRGGIYNFSESQIRFLCNRRFGVGADGLMLLNLAPGFDFEMKYYNSDGRVSSMCGNGGRCLSMFAYEKGLWKDKATFTAVDGVHEALLMDNGWVQLKMQDVNGVERDYDTAILNTGSPHFVKYAEHVDELDVLTEAKKIRYSHRFVKEGINVNFIEYGADALVIRTYERGVEDETLACGTGVTAAAIVAAGSKNQAYTVPVKAKGGNLEVRYEKVSEQYFRNIWLCGPAEFVFEGDIEIKE